MVLLIFLALGFVGVLGLMLLIMVLFMIYGDKEDK